MKNIVITGATSMLGLALIKECIKYKIEVLAIVRNNSNKIGLIPQSSLIEICECELQDMFRFTIPNVRYDCFYHFAWEHTARAEREDACLQMVNIQYCLEAVKLAKRLGCRKFIGAGSQAEYGHVETIIYPNTKVEPISAYGIAKYAAGKLSRKLCDEMHIVHIWGRIFSLYGPHDKDESMISYALNQVEKGELALFSHGNQMWNYLYEDDAGCIFYRLGEIVEKSKVYCIGSKKSRPLRDYIEELNKVLDGKLKCKFERHNTEEFYYGIQPDVTELWLDIGNIDETLFRIGIQNIYDNKRMDSI